MFTSSKESVGSVKSFSSAHQHLSWFSLGPGLLMMMFLIVFGLIVGLVSSGVFMKWVSMEMTFLAVAVCMARGSGLEIEGAMKYFVIQSVGSLLIFLSCFTISVFSENFMDFTSGGSKSLGLGNSHISIWGLFLLGFFIKLGLFPFDFWVPSVFKNSSYIGCFLMSGPQKLIPLILLSEVGFNGGAGTLMEVVALITSVKAGLSGIGVSDFRLLLAYSSLVQSGWMVIIFMESLFWGVFYLALYMLVLMGACFRLYELYLYSYKDLYNIPQNKTYQLGLLWYDLFSLAGLPPTLGWVSKLAGVFFLSFNNVLYLIGLVICSAMSLLMYIGLSFSLNLSSGSPSSGLPALGFGAFSGVYEKDGERHINLSGLSNSLSVVLMVVFGVIF